MGVGVGKSVLGLSPIAGGGGGGGGGAGGGGGGGVPPAAAPDAPRSGRVSYVSPTAEFTPKNVQTKNERVKLVFGVKVAVDDAGGRLKPGLPADAVFLEAEGTSHAGGD